MILKEILHALESMDCMFYGCPGPDLAFVDCATCIRCSLIQDLREIMAKGGEIHIPKPSPPSEPEPWPWKVRIQGAASSEFWEIVNMDTGKKVKIGKVQSRWTNHYDRAVREANRRNLIQALKEK